MLKNQSGMAAIEIIPVLVLFVLLINFTLGFFGVIHSGILNSIAARNYAFETFRNRTNLNYLRDEQSEPVTYIKARYRFHSVIGEQATNSNSWVATIRDIKFTNINTGSADQASTSDHNTDIRNMNDESKKTSEVFTGETKDDPKSGMSRVWVMTTYGICLTSKCDI